MSGMATPPLLGIASSWRGACVPGSLGLAAQQGAGGLRVVLQRQGPGAGGGIRLQASSWFLYTTIFAVDQRVFRNSPREAERRARRAGWAVPAAGTCPHGSWLLPEWKRPRRKESSVRMMVWICSQKVLEAIPALP